MTKHGAPRARWMDRPYRYLGNCTEFEGEDVNALNQMIDDGEPISYQTMLRGVGPPFEQWQANLGYAAAGRNKGALKMRRDWHVAYFRSTWKGTPCCFFVWSAIEYIFVEVTDAGRSGVPADDATQ